MARGYVRKRSKDSNRLQVYLGRDPDTGRELRYYETVRGDVKLAERRLVEVLAMVDSGQLGFSGLSGSSKVTLGEYLERWLTEEAGVRVRPRTLEGYEGHLRRYVIPRIGSVKLSALSARQVRSLESGLLRGGGRGGRPLSARTVLHVHRVLGKALNDAVDQGILRLNPVLAVRPPRALPYEARFLNWAEAHRLLAAVGSPLHRGIVFLCLHSGLRRSEVIGLRWGDLELERALLSVRRAVVQRPGRPPEVMPPKSGRSRPVDLPPEAVSVLAERLGSLDPVPSPSDYVFPDALGGPLRPDRVSSAFRRASIRAGLEGLRFHDLRHTHASLMLMMGVPLKVVSERLGHGGIAITADLYGHVAPSVQRDSARAFGEFWRSTVPGGM